MTKANARITKVTVEVATFDDGSSVLRQRPGLAPWYNKLTDGKFLTEFEFAFVFRVGDFANDAVIRLKKGVFDCPGDGRV